MIEFTIPGVPVPKGRPIFSIITLGRGPGAKHRVHVNTPQDTIDAEQALRAHARAHKPRKPLAGPLRVDTYFVVPAPTRFDADRSRDWPHVRPDDDNYRKLVLDALNKMFWHDDGQICAGESVKIYGHPPRTVVRISELTAADVLRVREMIGERELQQCLGPAPHVPGCYGGENG